MSSVRVREYELIDLLALPDEAGREGRFGVFPFFGRLAGSVEDLIDRDYFFALFFRSGLRHVD